MVLLKPVNWDTTTAAATNRHSSARPPWLGSSLIPTDTWHCRNAATLAF